MAVARFSTAAAGPTRRIRHHTAAFTQESRAATGIAIRPGTAGKSLIRNPGSWGVDFSLAKNFKISEGIKLQFQADMFNSLNHVNLGGPNTNINSGQFGRITVPVA